MEIHHFIYHLGTGGAEYVAVNLALHQSTTGHNVTLWTMGRPPGDSQAHELMNKHTSLLMKGGVAIRSLPHGQRSIIRNGRHLRKFFRQNLSNEIIFHAHSPVSAAVVAIANQGFRVLSLHSTRFNFPLSWMRLVLPRIDLVIAGSESVGKSLSQALNRSINVVPYGVHESMGSKLDRKDEAPNLIRLVFIGRLEPQKNPRRLIEALALARQSVGCRHRPIRVEMVGDGPLRHELESLCSATGLSDIVEFRGNIVDLDAFFLNADYLVMSSDFEGLPIVLLRALIDGLPTILTPFPAAIEVTQEFSGGIVASDFSNEALSQVLVEVFNDLILCNHFRSQLAYSKVEIRNRYSIPSMAEKYDKLYCEMIY